MSSDYGETASTGACSLIPDTSSKTTFCSAYDNAGNQAPEGYQYCSGAWTATSSGEVNTVGSGSGSTEPMDVPDYLTPVEECATNSCVTIDGQRYEVDQSQIDTDSQFTSINTDGTSIHFYANGGFKLTQADGSYEIMDADGNSTYYNADGSVDPDGGSDSGSDGGSDSGSGSDGGDSGSGIDWSDDGSDGTSTPGTSTDEEGNPEGMGDGDGDSTLGDVVGSITNLKNRMMEGFDGTLDGVREYFDEMVEGIASSGPDGELTESVGTAEENHAKATGALEEVKGELTGVIDGSDSELTSVYDQMGSYFGEFFPQLPQPACTPLTFAPGAEYSFTIQCDVFEMIREALAWIFYALTVYFILSTMFSARPS